MHNSHIIKSYETSSDSLLFPEYASFFAGEKLSKQELQTNLAMKKLRQKDKESDERIATLKYLPLLIPLIFYFH